MLYVYDIIYVIMAEIYFEYFFLFRYRFHWCLDYILLSSAPYKMFFSAPLFVIIILLDIITYHKLRDRNRMRFRVQTLSVCTTSMVQNVVISNRADFIDEIIFCLFHECLWR